MKVWIHALIPHIVKRIEALKTQVIKDQVEDLRLKKEYESKFFPRLFGWKYQSIRGYWNDTSEQRLVKEERKLKELLYLRKNDLDEVVNLSDYINPYNARYLATKDAILKEHGEVICD